MKTIKLLSYRLNKRIHFLAAYTEVRITRFFQLFVHFSLVLLQGHVLGSAIPSILYPIFGLITSFLSMVKYQAFSECYPKYKSVGSEAVTLFTAVSQTAAYQFGLLICKYGLLIVNIIVYYLMIIRPFKQIGLVLYHLSSVLMTCYLLIGYGIIARNISILNTASEENACASESTFSSMTIVNNYLILIVNSLSLLIPHYLLYFARYERCCSLERRKEPLTLRTLGYVKSFSRRLRKKDLKLLQKTRSDLGSTQQLVREEESMEGHASVERMLPQKNDFGKLVQTVVNEAKPAQRLLQPKPNQAQPISTINQQQLSPQLQMLIELQQVLPDDTKQFEDEITNYPRQFAPAELPTVLLPFAKEIQQQNEMVIDIKKKVKKVLLRRKVRITKSALDVQRDGQLN
ncbi:hypothetical protein FGO68_gene425 [Halteria grandinella]|uniref:Uncharacterized protein n=1 Tax=Halteria grandinella TaxID=5974 RepID=A0A8J8NPT1_HALGN|nr:hypothetical protein FGO68_gene425 [Halteria grandinella]